MMIAREGDTVLVHYTGRLPDGTVFDSSRGRDPMRVTLGGREVIAGFERAIVGMRPGSTVIENIPAAHAFGPVRSELVWVVDRAWVVDDGDLVCDRTVHVRTRSGKKVSARVLEVMDSRVKVDANHPLAGHALTFEIELVEIIDGARVADNRVPPGARESKIILPGAS